MNIALCNILLFNNIDPNLSFPQLRSLWSLSQPNILDNQSPCSQHSFCLESIFSVTSYNMSFIFFKSFLKGHPLTENILQINISTFIPTHNPYPPLTLLLYFLRSAYNFLTYCVIYFCLPPLDYMFHEDKEFMCFFFITYLTYRIPFSIRWH